MVTYKSYLRKKFKTDNFKSWSMSRKNEVGNLLNRINRKMQIILRSEFVGAWIHFHKPNGRLASANGHSLPLTACSWQSAFYSLSGDEKIPFSVFHDIYKIEQWKTQNINLQQTSSKRSPKECGNLQKKSISQTH